MAQDVTDFYDVETKPTGLPTGSKNRGVYYSLAVVEAEVGEWDDGRPRLDLRTEVIAGEYTGKFGPLHSFSLGGYTGEREDGRPFTISPVEQIESLIKFTQTVHPERILFSKKVGWDNAASEYLGLDAETLGEIGTALVGYSFIAKVRLDKRGRMRMSDIHNPSDPPDGFESEAAAEPFVL